MTINGSVAQFSCKCSIPKELWDAKDNRAKGKGREARDINLSLDNIRAQIISHYQRLSDREAFVTADMVRSAYQGIGTEYKTLPGAFDKDNESFKKRIGTDRALGTGSGQEAIRHPSSGRTASGVIYPYLNLLPTSSRSMESICQRMRVCTMAVYGRTVCG